MPQKAYLKWVKNQIDLESACLELPFTILLLSLGLLENHDPVEKHRGSLFPLLRLSFSAFAIFSLKQDSAVMVSVEL